MSDDLIDRLAAWVYRAVMQLPLGSAASQKPGAFAAAPVANPALRYRKLQLAAEHHSRKMEDSARLWSRLNLFVTRAVLISLVIGAFASLLVVREVRYSISMRKALQNQPAGTTPHVATPKGLKAIRVPIKFSLPVALTGVLLGLGCRKVQGRVRRRQLIEIRKRDDFAGFLLRRRQISQPLPEDCDLLEMHLNRLNAIIRFRQEQSFWHRLRRRLTLPRWLSLRSATQQA